MRNNSKAMELLTFLDSFELNLHANEATHQHGSIIDLVITAFNNNFSELDYLFLGITVCSQLELNPNKD